VLGVTIACLDFLDPPLERRRLRFRDKLGAIREALPASGGFGLICFGLITIPFLNLFSIPLCITAGTLFFCDQIDIDQR
jgi:CysZ protein